MLLERRECRSGARFLGAQLSRGEMATLAFSLILELRERAERTYRDLGLARTVTRRARSDTEGRRPASRLVTQAHRRCAAHGLLAATSSAFSVSRLLATLFVNPLYFRDVDSSRRQAEASIRLCQPVVIAALSERSGHTLPHEARPVVSPTKDSGLGCGGGLRRRTYCGDNPRGRAPVSSAAEGSRS